jgi:hypothetical protein
MPLSTLNNMQGTPFDQKLEIWKGHIPEDVVDAAVFVNDTLELSWASAQSVFGEKATPEIALAIFDRLAARLPSRKTPSEG